MSATGRNLDGNERHERDFYETPAWATDAILPHLRIPSTALDAGAGSAAIMARCLLFWPGAHSIRGVDLVPQAPRVEVGDFLQWKDRHDLIIANPPYALSEAFAERAIMLANEVAFLLRINWLASKKRSAFHRRFPCDLFVLPKRPSFTGGGTDATEYAWFVWGEGRGNRWFLLEAP